MSGRDATVSWAQNSPAFLGGFLGADANGGYLIERYAESGGGSVAPAASCSGLRQGGGNPLSCTEADLPTGHWQYTVTPKYYNWLGDGAAPARQRSSRPRLPPRSLLTTGSARAMPTSTPRTRAASTSTSHCRRPLLSSDTVHLTAVFGRQPARRHGECEPLGGRGDDCRLRRARPVHNGRRLFDVHGVRRELLRRRIRDTSIVRTKDTVDPVVNVTAGRSPDSNGRLRPTRSRSPRRRARTRAEARIDSCDPDVVYGGPDTSTGSLPFLYPARTTPATRPRARSPSSTTRRSRRAARAVATPTGATRRSRCTLSATNPNSSGWAAGRGDIAYTVDAGSPQTVTGDSGTSSSLLRPTTRTTASTRSRSTRPTTPANDETPSNSVTVREDRRPPEPETTATGADSNWHNSAVTVHLASSDPRYPSTGSGVVDLRYQVGAGAPVDVAGASGVASTDVMIPAPSNGSNDGQHTMSYHATDGATYDAEVRRLGHGQDRRDQANDRCERNEG